MYAVQNQLPLNYLCPLILSFSLTLSHSLFSPLPHHLPDALMEIIQKWEEMKSLGSTSSLSNHICSSHTRHSSNWGAHFLSLLKGHLLLKQRKHCISFSCTWVLYDCGTSFTFNKKSKCPEFLYLSWFKSLSNFWIFWTSLYLMSLNISVLNSSKGHMEMPQGSMTFIAFLLLVLRVTLKAFKVCLFPSHVL